MKDTSNLKLIREKRITLKKQKKNKIKMNIMFLIGFLIPTINAIYQWINVKEGNMGYIFAMLVFIALDILIYIPIFIINRDIYNKGKHKILLLIFLQIRNLEKLMLAIYSLIYFIISNNITFNLLFTDFIGSMKILASNGWSLGLSVSTALFTLLAGNTNRQFKREIFDAKFTVSTYTRDEETGDIIRKTYINKLNYKGIIIKNIIYYLIEWLFIIGVFYLIIRYL